MSLLLWGWLLLAPLSAQVPQEGPWSAKKASSTGAKADRELAAIQRRIDKGELPRIEFDPGSAVLRPGSHPVLDLIADVLLKNPDIRVIVSGHACALDSDERNLELSRRRARAVQAYLMKQGVPPTSLRTRGWGAAQPLADNSTEEGRRRNDRVEFRVLRGDWGAIY